MKKISGVKAVVVIVLLVGMVAAFAGCASLFGSRGADSVATKYYEAIADGDVEAIEAVASPEMAQFWKSMPDEFITKAQEDMISRGEQKFREIKMVDGDTAVITTTWENGQERLTFKKIDGEWKATLN